MEDIKQNQLHLTNGKCTPPEGGSGSVRLGRLKAPTPHSTTFCQPWSCYASPYPGWQNVSYLNTLGESCENNVQGLMKE
jgi:hypothetical protein